MVKNKKGQSTVEYIILFAAVIAILIVFLSPAGPFRGQLNSSYQAMSNELGSMANRLANSHQ